MQHEFSKPPVHTPPLEKAVDEWTARLAHSRNKVYPIDSVVAHTGTIIRFRGAQIVSPEMLTPDAWVENDGGIIVCILVRPEAERPLTAEHKRRIGISLLASALCFAAAAFTGSSL